MTALLTDNLPLLAGAPNGIKKLRELILELAVRGKLVEQDARDEPASELLKRIAAEKARLVAEGKIKKQKPLVDIREEDKPFDVPANWAWVRVAAVGHDWGQKTPDQKFTYIDVGSVDNAVGMISAPQVLVAEDAPSRARKVVRLGTVIYSTIRPYLLNIAVINEEYAQEPIASTAFAIIHPYLDMPSKYYLWYLRSPVFVRYVESVQMGIAYPAINDGQFFNGLIPLPPLAEQHRIVAKVDELMALCDHLEIKQADAASAHAQLVQALLGSLTQASDATEFSANWQCLAEHFHTLFSTESSIDALKQTLLQLAVRGKLLEQNADDESVSQLLISIEKEKAQLIERKTIRKGKPLPDIEQDEMQFKLPIGWEWIRLGQVGDWGAGATPARGNSNYYGGEMPWFKSGELVADFISDSEETVTELALKECSLRRNKPGDVLVAMYGATIGKTAILSVEGTTNQAVCACTPFTGVFNRYLLLTLKALKSNFIGQGAGGAQPNISREKIVATVTGLPPLAEQHRIVAKVDQLMRLCDTLKQQITAINGKQTDLLKALIAQV